jgi:hypothetical protein
LIDAQRNFRDFGAAERHVKPFVRAATADDRLEPGWRLLDTALDNVEVPERGKEYGMTYPADHTVLYYWRDTYWRRHGD